ncbi:uncharacterized protein LDX57_011546 [Aspergillus melleus]|uniref:uncharacterized protein n=1 Tax=Aspergillus melleus TaxID=138277 RepID=UPI001E8CFB11|nr:uncharacterized protein LDX57_011546 [Aspergillus melleus]KAH8433910.1 hypothetical protein LDX57_011546 [Aspergillus melleus]
MELRYRNGLPKQFKLKEAQFKLSKRHVLKIHYNNKNVMLTSNGIPSSGSGLASHLITRSDIGMLDAVTDVAHEIRHMFGLLHEHQDSMFWGTGISEPVFTFNCQDLKDHDEKTKGKTGEQINGANGICESREEAAKAGFSAVEFLPLMGSTALAAGPEDVDWDSIMLYASGAGGQASTQTRDRRAPALLKKKGNEETKPKTKPSAKDVQALKNLYKIK